ncbi:MAG: dihydroorotate dehydrogenase (quinone) [Pseudomonadota bacterium]
MTASAAARLFDLSQPLLSRLSPELAHAASLRALAVTWRVLHDARKSANERPVSLLGLRFANPLGLAAGCDKNGDYLDALGSLGFGHVEIGTVTPRPQAGNPRPRLFRVPTQRAVVNRMGFNNKGIDHVVTRLQRRRYTGICGVNIGKNADTPLARAEDDYLLCFRKAYSQADYFVINVSSPNTAGLRDLQSEEGLERIAGALFEERRLLASATKRCVPVLVKIAPDLAPAEIISLAALIGRLQFDGVVATNTTIDLAPVAGVLPAGVTGGLSGAPLHARSLDVIRRLRSALGPEYPIIGVGGICDAASAADTLQAGANLIQLYTGFIFRGPALIDEILCGANGQRS